MSRIWTEFKMSGDKHNWSRPSHNNNSKCRCESKLKCCTNSNSNNNNNSTSYDSSSRQITSWVPLKIRKWRILTNPHLSTMIDFYIALSKFKVTQAFRQQAEMRLRWEILRWKKIHDQCKTSKLSIIQNYPKLARTAKVGRSLRLKSLPRTREKKYTKYNKYSSKLRSSNLSNKACLI